jgi:beta-lactamase regulating signal transducer with metallopeptidase domain
VDVFANWIWQACAVTGTATIMMRVLPRTSATLRYRVWWVTLAIVLALPWIPVLMPHRDVVSAPVAVEPGAASTAIVLPNLPSWVETMLLGAWIVWVVRSLSLVATAFGSLAHAKRSAHPFPVARESRLPFWTTMKSRGRAATLVISDDVRSAAVLGLGKPTIAVAPTVLEDLTDRDLDQVLVHEWAHVQRRDDIGRLVQVLVKTIAGLHPAVWWIDRQLDLERESACDDWSVNLVGSAKGYAACLIRLATLQNGHTDGMLMPAAWTPSTLTTRIVRVLDGRRNRSTHRKLPSLAFMSALLAVTALVAAGFELVVKPESISDSQPPPQFNAPTSQPVRNSRDAISPTERARTESAPERRGPASPNRGRLTPSAHPVATNDLRSSQTPTRAASTVTASPQHPLETASISVAPAVLTTLPGTHAPVTELAPDVVDTPDRSPAAENVTPWRAAADAGTSVGRGSQKAAVATASFFSRLGKSIAGAF